jgi:hypothetical protein
MNCCGCCCCCTGHRCCCCCCSLLLLMLWGSSLSCVAIVCARRRFGGRGHVAARHALQSACFALRSRLRFVVAVLGVCAALTSSSKNVAGVAAALLLCVADVHEMTAALGAEHRRADGHAGFGHESQQLRLVFEQNDVHRTRHGPKNLENGADDAARLEAEKCSPRRAPSRAAASACTITRSGMMCMICAKRTQRLVVAQLKRDLDRLELQHLVLGCQSSPVPSWSTQLRPAFCWGASSSLSDKLTSSGGPLQRHRPPPRGQSPTAARPRGRSAGHSDSLERLKGCRRRRHSNERRVHELGTTKLGHAAPPRRQTWDQCRRWQSSTTTTSHCCRYRCCCRCYRCCCRCRPNSPRLVVRRRQGSGTSSAFSNAVAAETTGTSDASTDASTVAMISTLKSSFFSLVAEPTALAAAVGCGSVDSGTAVARDVWSPKAPSACQLRQSTTTRQSTRRRGCAAQRRRCGL